MGKTSLKDIAGILVLVGALNWGLIALSPDLNLVSMVGDLVGPDADNKFCRTFDRIVYFLVGVSAVYMLLNSGK